MFILIQPTTHAITLARNPFDELPPAPRRSLATVGSPPQPDPYGNHSEGKQAVVAIIDTVAANEPDWVFASTIRAMRRRLGATDARLSRVSGITRQRIEAIEIGGASTRAERNDITAALTSLSKHRIAKALARRRFAR